MTSERSIPHLRDIFGINNYTTPNNHNNSINNNQITGINGIGHGHGNGHGNGHGGYVPVDNYNNHQPIVDPTKKSSSKKKRDNSKTLTSGDVKTLERHLSMKKTIRKKIMRDLQQAFVEDPNEFKIENSNHEQLKAEIRVEALRFGEKPTRKSDNFLDMLRGEKPTATYGNNNSNAVVVPNRDYDYDSPTSVVQPVVEKQSFWRRFTMKKSKR